MAKIDELTELLVEELDQFKKNLIRFEKINESILKASIKPDLNELTSLLRTQNQENESVFKKHQTLFSNVEQHLKKSIQIPQWLLGIISGVLIITFSFIGYSYHKISSITQIEKTAFKQGETKAFNHFILFLDNYPKSKKEYNNWMDSKNK